MLWILLLQHNVASECRESKARTQRLNFLSENSSIQLDTDTDCMIETCRGHRTWFLRAERNLSLFMGAFGIDIRRVARSLDGLNQGSITGSQNLSEIEQETERINVCLKSWDGRCLLFGNAKLEMCKS